MSLAPCEVGWDDSLCSVPPRYGVRRHHLVDTSSVLYGSDQRQGSSEAGWRCLMGTVWPPGGACGDVIFIPSRPLGPKLNQEAEPGNRTENEGSVQKACPNLRSTLRHGHTPTLLLSSNRLGGAKRQPDG